MKRKKRNERKRWLVYDSFVVAFDEYFYFSFFKDPEAETNHVSIKRKEARLYGRWGLCRKKPSGLTEKRDVCYRQKAFRKLCATWNPSVCKWGGRYYK